MAEEMSPRNSNFPKNTIKFHNLLFREFKKIETWLLLVLKIVKNVVLPNNASDNFN